MREDVLETKYGDPPKPSGGIRVPLLLLCLAHGVEVGHADLNQLGDLTHALLGRLLGVDELLAQGGFYADLYNSQFDEAA